MTGPATAESLVTVLADQRLRAVVTALGTAGEPLTVRELARRLVSSDVSPDGRIERVEVELYHDCVPRLSDLGVVSFDRESMTATLTYDTRGSKRHSRRWTANSKRSASDYWWR